MAVTRDEVMKIAGLANLAFSEAEADVFVSQFQHILDYIEKLGELDTTGIEPTSHVSLLENRDTLREDEVRKSLPVEESLLNAPDSGNGHFRVPKVI